MHHGRDLPRRELETTSYAAFMPVSPPTLIASCHPLTSDRSGARGSPSTISSITPIASEWSATTSQSSGRLSLTGSPVEADDLLAARELQRLLGPEHVAARAGVERHGRVQVRVAPVDARRVVPARVGREAGLLEQLRRVLRVDGPMSPTGACWAAEANASVAQAARAAARSADVTLMEGSSRVRAETS